MSENPGSQQTHNQQSSSRISPYKDDKASIRKLMEHLDLQNPESIATFTRFVKLANRFLKAPICLFAAFDDDTPKAIASTGLSRSSSNIEAQVDSRNSSCDICLKVGEHRKLLVETDIETNASLKHCHLFNESNIVGFMGTPILAPNGFLIGVFLVADIKARLWTQDEISLMQELGQLITQEIEYRYRELSARNKLHETKSQLEKVLAAADCLVWEAEVMLDNDDWNWTFNIQPSGLFNRIFNELLPPPNVGLWYRFNIEQQQEMNERCKAALKNNLSSYEQQFEIKTDTDNYWIQEKVTISHLDTHTFWLVGVATDITSSKIMENKLSMARDKAIESDRLKSEFLANVSHEIRTPMNGIIGMANLLDQDITDPDQKQMNQLVLKSAEALLGVIDDVLDFSKIESKRIRIRQEPFNLKAIIDDVSELQSKAARAKSISLRYFADKTLPDVLIGDATRIRQIVVNLLGNAIKFTDEGWVDLSLSYTMKPDNEVGIRIDVKDTGPGIGYHAQHHIFHPFVQEDGSHTRKHEGSGLGLTISKKLTDLMGGTLDFTSKPGHGSHFWFEITLPIDTSAEAPPSNNTDFPKLKKADTLNANTIQHQKHLLVVDDNPTNRLVCELMLKQMGMQVSVATNGQHAIDMLAQQNFDAVIMDCQMPVMDGYEATRMIRTANVEGLDATIPVIALTAHAMIGDRERCLQSGMNDYLSKPIRKEEIKEALVKNGVLAA